MMSQSSECRMINLITGGMERQAERQRKLDEKKHFREVKASRDDLCVVRVGRVGVVCVLCTFVLSQDGREDEISLCCFLRRGCVMDVRVLALMCVWSRTSGKTRSSRCVVRLVCRDDPLPVLCWWMRGDGVWVCSVHAYLRKRVHTFVCVSVCVCVSLHGLRVCAV
jgi:hypothetical protein